MPIFEIFAVAAPEIFAATEGTAAVATAAETAAAAEAAAQAAAATQAAAAAQSASGIMGAADPALMQSVNTFAPETSMFGPQSTQLANATNGSYTDWVAKNPLTSALDTPNNIGNIPGGSSPPTVPDFDQFLTPTQTGSYPGGSTAPTTLDANTFPTPNQAGFQPGGSTEPTVSNFRTANDIRTEGQSPLMRGLNSATDWIKDNPWKTAGLAAMVGSKLMGSSNPQAPDTTYNGPLNNFRISPDFKGRHANPQDFQYTPIQYKYASGGITDAPAIPTSHHDVGIVRDTDPDTMYLDPLTAAMVRQSKLDSRSYVDTKAKFNRPTPMGTLNLKPVTAAQGGIMQAQRFDGGGVTGAGGLNIHVPLDIGNGGGGVGGGGALGALGAALGSSGFSNGMNNAGGIGESGLGGGMGGGMGVNAGQQGGSGIGDAMSGILGQMFGGGGANSQYAAFAGGGAVPGYDLGGYATGGNPRLLSGPGDGMSDNIPATINDRQPARLADGEFVVPADVVSHLGNGSTEAGAKKLHEMMNHVRKARTGNQEQGKQINPNKFIPK